MAENDQERTETATPRRRQEARQEGNVARSVDLSAAAALLAAVVGLYFFGLHLITGLRTNVQAMLSGSFGPNPTRADDLIAMSYAERVAQPCIGQERADLVLAGCAILEALLRMWPCQRLRVADRGLREGILTTLMAEDGHDRRYVARPRRGRDRAR